VAFLTGLWFSRFFGIEGMGSMTTVAFVLNSVASFTKGFFQRVGKGPVLRMVFHPVPRDVMSSLLELVIFLRMTLSTYLGFDHRFFWNGILVAFMTGDTIHSILGMLAIDPGLKDPTRLSLMTGQAVTNLFLGPSLYRDKKGEDDEWQYHSLQHDLPPFFGVCP